MTQRNFADVIARLFTAVMVMMVGMAITSCTDTNAPTSRSVEPITQTSSPDPSREISGIDSIFLCDVNGNRFDHSISLEMGIKVKDAEALETTLKGDAKSSGILSLDKETIRVDEDSEKPYQLGETSYNEDSTKAIITVSDSRILTLDFKSGKKSLEWMNVVYGNVYDQLAAARLVSVEFEEPMTRAGESVPSKYVKRTLITKYLVEVTTKHHWSDVTYGTDKDTLVVAGTTLEMADNGTTNKIDKVGVKVITETQQKDSVEIIKSWDDGHTEKMVFNTILNRWLKSIDRREVIVNAFDNQNAASSFSTVPKVEEKLVREEPNFKVYGREVVVTKMVSVAGHMEEVRYTYYQERADFNYKETSYSFGYVDWTIGNYADDFKSEPISSKSGYDQLSYKNEIKTYYLDYIQMADEVIDWFKKTIEIVDYDVINAKRYDYPTFTYVSLDKIAIYSDGTNKKVGSYSAEIPVNVTPLSAWVINTDILGTYVSNEFSGTQTSKSAQTAEKFFAYNRYGYTYTNTVSGQTNKFTVNVPNDITFNDGDVKYTFKNSELAVSKVKDATAEAGDDDELTTYKYTCVAGVTFGESAQEVTLPGTINVTKDNGPHIHGKVKAVYFTTTPNESRSFYKSVCVIEFEDGYRSVGLSDNGANEFNFNMSSWKYVNSAVYTGGNWIPAIAEDNTGAKCMVWKNEDGAAKRTLDYITATRDSWNNGHNTVVDIRRSYEISKTGYTVTLKLDGSANQTLKF